MSRKLARETAMKLIYQTEIQKTDIEEQISYTLENENLKPPDRTYIEDVVTGAIKYRETIDGLIESFLKGWKMNRISKVDLSILRLCIFEIYYREDIPLSVSINEAVELAKKYGNEESSAFINGILSSVASHKGEV